MPIISALIILSRCIFFFNDSATTEIYTLSLHDALPIFTARRGSSTVYTGSSLRAAMQAANDRSEEHTSELQSRLHLVCRLLLEKKNHQRVSRSRCPVHC